MNIKYIISKTITFIGIVIPIMLFNGIFGDENLLIGVMSVALMLMLLERDLTVHPVKHTLQLVGLNLVMGIAAFIATSNLWLAIPINLVLIFILGHSLLYDLKKPIYMPFILQYLFILFTPITLNQLPKRLLALVVGALIIMLVQILVNRNKLTQAGDKLIEQVIQSLMKKIEDMRKGISDSEDEIAGLLRELRKMISDRRKDELHLTEEARIKLSLSVALEKIALSLEKMDYIDLQKECVEDVYQFLDLAKDVFKDKTKIEQINHLGKNLVSKYDKEKVSDQVAVEMGYNIAFLNDSLQELHMLDKDKYNLVKNVEEVSTRYQCLFNKKYIKIDTVKFSFATRLAIGITLTTFMSQYFNLAQGKWMVFTILALVVPIYEVSKQKSKDRVIATITGGILALILFSIFTDTLTKVILLLLVGYINMYFTRYRYTSILYTTLAIGAASLAGEIQVLTINRIIFVIVGLVMATLINKLILHYNLEDNNNYLIHMYQATIDEMKKEAQFLMEGQASKYSIKNLLIITSMIEDKLLMNNQILEDNQIEVKLDESRALISDIYHFYICKSQAEVYQ
ncbi:FUSC family protein [Niameybacter massiliensis]|uniref:FUSC family protein n=1 Tax=Holtiella tumoricola TaxID=3018743 RepID=A0AA42DKY1_9FIRM|nr:FUSC family protein [Holtiella tumoricola]MDA3730995.1 FUSC family protein [Holtiella tumoricola]